MASAERRRKRAVNVPLLRFAVASAAPYTMTQTEQHSSVWKGGANSIRKVYEDNDREIPPPQNARDVKNFLSEAMARIRAGRMDPKIGTTLGYLGISLLRAIETSSDIEERLEKLEHGLKGPSQEAGTDRN